MDNDYDAGDVSGFSIYRYNCPMRRNTPSWLALLMALVMLVPHLKARAAQGGEVTAFDLIIAMNTLRASYGLPPLVEDPIIDAVAQGTAEIMAANNMSSHIRDVRGRLQAAGHGGGATVWRPRISPWDSPSASTRSCPR
jgi:uncharacterized protein YkwD